MKKLPRYFILALLLLLISVRPISAAPDEYELTSKYTYRFEQLFNRLQSELRRIIYSIKIPDEVLIPRPKVNPSIVLLPTDTITPTLTLVHNPTDLPVSITPTIIPISTILTISEPAATPISTPEIAVSPSLPITLTPTSANYPENNTITDYLIKAVNSYRLSLGLTEVKTDQYTCDFAKIRAVEISTAFNHDGFTKRVESNTLPYPPYSKVTENIAVNSDYRKIVSGWIASPGHAENMQQETPFVCVEKYGNYYAYEGLRLE